MFFLLPFIAMGQTYKYIGIEDGLSNRRIFNIQKDSKDICGFLPMREWTAIMAKK